MVDRDRHYEIGTKCPLKYLQVQVTTLVSLLFTTIIPIHIIHLLLSEDEDDKDKGDDGDEKKTGELCQ